MTLLDEVGAYLVAQNVGTEGTDLFLGFLPSSPDACVVVYEYAGQAPVNTGANYQAYELPRVQIVARALTYQAARAKVQTVWSLFNAGLGTMGGHAYYAVTPLQSPFLFQRDPSERVLMAFNAEAMRVLT